MFIMIVISASSVALAAEDPLRGDLSKKNEYLNYMDFIFTGVFTVEMILKVIKGVLKSIPQCIFFGNPRHTQSLTAFIPEIPVKICIVLMLLTCPIKGVFYDNYSFIYSRGVNYSLRKFTPLEKNYSLRKF